MSGRIDLDPGPAWRKFATVRRVARICGARILGRSSGANRMAQDLRRGRPAHLRSGSSRGGAFAEVRRGGRSRLRPPRGRTRRAPDLVTTQPTWWRKDRDPRPCCFVDYKTRNARGPPHASPAAYFLPRRAGGDPFSLHPSALGRDRRRRTPRQFTIATGGAPPATPNSAICTGAFQTDLRPIPQLDNP